MLPSAIRDVPDAFERSRSMANGQPYGRENHPPLPRQARLGG